MNLYQTTRELLSSYNLHPKKRLGQNFLVDKTVLRRIVAAAELSPTDKILEIGCGLGVLTQALAEKAEHVTSLDKDRDMVQIAKQVAHGQAHPASRRRTSCSTSSSWKGLSTSMPTSA